VDKASKSSLKRKRVVVTRAAEQSESLVQVLREAGAVPVVLPMVAIGPPDDLSGLDEAIRNFPNCGWLFLTSQNALRAIQNRCQSLRIDLVQALAGARIAAVGPATAEAIEGAGLRVAHLASRHHGVALAEELAEQVKGRYVLLPRSDRANPELVETLKRFGAQVTEVVAYRTISPSSSDLVALDTLAREGADAVLFFSPSAVHHLQELLGNEKFLELSQRAIFAAIGPVTRDALLAARIERVVMARDTTVPAVLEALAHSFSEHVPGLSAGVKPG
jgi:uroporphyrinogen III methyltransferase/synthase